MTTAGKRPNLLRMRRGHEHARVGFVELFFDLVFVFAITQLSHVFLEHFTLLGAIQTTLLLMAVWWVWIYTSWVTNWLDPEAPSVRLMLFVLMLAGLVLSASLPEAFGSRGLAFAAAYVFMQVGRSLFMMWALGPDSPRNRRNFQRITAWLVLSGVFWIAGGLADGATRFGLWALALFLDYLSPAVGFFVPGLGRSTTADWDVEGGHMAERCGLFIIIALGESILVTGATFSSLRMDAGNRRRVRVGVRRQRAMWWIYFSIGAERGSRLIATAADPGRLARLAYTYIHLLIVAGIIVAAVADEFVLAHPTGHTDLETTVAVLSGPVLYPRRATSCSSGRRPIGFPSRISSASSCLVLLVPISLVASPLMLAAAAALVLVLVAIWEWLSLGPVVAATSHA